MQLLCSQREEILLISIEVGTGCLRAFRARSENLSKQGVTRLSYFKRWQIEFYSDKTPSFKFKEFSNFGFRINILFYYNLLAIDCTLGHSLQVDSSMLKLYVLK